MKRTSIAWVLGLFFMSAVTGCNPTTADRPAPPLPPSHAVVSPERGVDVEVNPPGGGVHVDVPPNSAGPGTRVDVGPGGVNVTHPGR